VNLTPETLLRLSKINNIVGVKEASGNIKQMSDVLTLCGEQFDVLSGDDAYTLPLMALGGKGIISVISNVAPADMSAMVDAFEAGNLAKSKALHHKMIPLIDSLFIETNPVPVKAALGMMGKISYEVRAPLCKMSDTNYDKLKKVMIQYGLISS
jgi:4-hydroxy-tetrahydrodipicolinate synthase